jgi:hypothetical protein
MSSDDHRTQITTAHRTKEKRGKESWHCEGVHVMNDDACENTCREAQDRILLEEFGNATGKAAKSMEEAGKWFMGLSSPNGIGWAAGPWRLASSSRGRLAASPAAGSSVLPKAEPQAGRGRSRRGGRNLGPA